MRYYFAPMEGLTDSIYRQLHHKYFGGVDRYYMPFISPTIHRCLTHKEDRELPMADSVPFCAVPQLMTRVADDFLWAAEQCRDRGYCEVNLNAGCPSGTVVAKGKGAGMLADPAELNRFLDGIFSKSCLPISVKTRLGMTNPEEFPALLEVYNRYPIAELIIHPRVRKQFYDGGLHMEMIQYALENSKNSLCFNGELRSNTDFFAFSRDFPQIQSVMVGRGLIADPGMLLPDGTQPAVLETFMQELLDTYATHFGSSRNAMFRLKEHWSYLLPRFADSEKLGKRLRKATDLQQYQVIVSEIFHTLSFQ